MLKTIIHIHLGLEYKIHQEGSELGEDNIKIIYSKKGSNYDGITMYQHPLLTEDVIYAQDIEVMNDKEWPYFFHSFAFRGDYNFDLFAMVFYLLTRYEEYLRFHPDQFGRFSGHQSLAYRNGFLEIPLIDHWILDLRQRIIEKYEVGIPIPRSYKSMATVDIDTPYAFSNRPFITQIGSIFRDIYLLRKERIKYRLLTVFGYKKDVFDTYELLLKKIDKHRHNAIFFFLMRCHLPHDQNFSVRSRAFKKMVKNLAQNAKVGIHPSLMTTNSQKALRQEIDLLEKYADQDIRISRQHFLCIKFPDSFRKLVNEGITDDYSMGYHDLSGFRASTAVPFQWYDLKKEEVTDFIIHPVVLMDATLRRHHSFDISSAKNKVIEIKNAVKAVDGTFIFIWHNSSFAELYGWDRWEDVLDECFKD